MILYTPELLAELFGEKSKWDLNTQPQIPYSIDYNSPAGKAIRNRHEVNVASQKQLRDVMQLLMPPGLDPRVVQRKFFHTYGIDTLSAQGLTSSDADALRHRILEKLT